MNYTITHNLTNLTKGNITLTIQAEVGYQLPSSISVSNGTLVSYDSTTGVAVINGDDTTIVNVVCEAQAVVDPVLANNDWATIKSVCQSGNAGNYWAVGDTKNVTGGDNAVRPVMIVDMQGLYSKHVVFQFRYRTEQNYVWQGSANDGNYYNNYNLATIRTTINSGGNAYTEMIPNDLGSELTDTTVKVAKNGGDGTLVDVTDKLFLPAEKEVWTSRKYSRTEEFTALTTFQYYTTHTSNSDHMIPRPSAVGQTSGNVWWLRSPCSDYSNGVCGVNSSGGASNYDADDSRGVAPCFAF